jgi:hypothetical protein
MALLTFQRLMFFYAEAGRVTFGHGIGEAHHDADRNSVRK